MIDHLLIQQMNQALIDLDMLAHGPTSNLEPQVRQSKVDTGERPRGPSGQEIAERDRLRHTAAQAVAADDERTLRRTLLAARTHVARVKGNVPLRVRDERGVIDTPEDEQRVVDIYRGLSPEEVAMCESTLGSPCNAAYIRKLRARYDCRPDNGMARPPAEFRMKIARRLESEGRTEAKIAMELGISKTQVRRLLGRDTERKAA